MPRAAVDAETVRALIAARRGETARMRSDRGRAREVVAPPRRA